MKTISDLENMKSQKNLMFANAYEFFISKLEDYYIAKSDGKMRIRYELELWDKEAQLFIANVLIKRIGQSMIDFDPNDILSLIQ